MVGYRQTNQKTDTGKTLTRWPVFVDHFITALDGDTEMQAVTRIGMYSGMRLNEICSLRVENIRRIEGILCFEVTEGKTKSAARIIPIHSLIIDLVEALLQKPHRGFLFYRA